MAKRRKVTVTWADGTESTRASESKTYSHAWRVNYNVDGRNDYVAGFSTTQQLASSAGQSQANVLRRHGRFSVLGVEVVAVVEV